MHIVQALLSMKIAGLRCDLHSRSGHPSHPGDESSYERPRHQSRAINTEVLIAQQPGHPGLFEDDPEQLFGDVGFQQTFSVLAEGRVNQTGSACRVAAPWSAAWTM